MDTPLKSTPLVAPGHTRPITHLSFSPIQEDGTFLLVSSCKDGNPMLREWTGDWIGTFLGHKGAVWSTKLSLDGSRAASGSADFTAKVWDTYSGTFLHSFPHNHIVRSKKVRIFDLNRPDAEPDFLFDSAPLSHDGTIKSVVWVGEHTGVTAGEDGKVKWWDLRSREMTQVIAFPDPITTHSLTLRYAPSSASIHPIHQDRFVTGSMSDEWVRVHGINGEEREVLKGHHGPVHCVEFSPDGEMYASGSEDGTIRLWQTTPGKTYGLWQGASTNGH
ncbi:serine/threonine kinase receptor associated protein [Pholiota molesta]|nr:serine/threonine kinase receptor associated protein [Pholiota molesta]